MMKLHHRAQCLLLPTLWTLEEVKFLFHICIHIPSCFSFFIIIVRHFQIKLNLQFFSGSKAAKRLNENLLSEFFDISYWKPEAGYCGTVYRGLLGEVMLDLRTPAHRQEDLQPDQEQEDLQPLEQQHLQPLTVESLIESELKKLSENKNNNNIITTDVVGKDSFEEVDSEILSMKRSSPEQDEGFCDKSSTVTGPSSPDSYNLQLEDE